MRIRSLKKTVGYMVWIVLISVFFCACAGRDLLPASDTPDNAGNYGESTAGTSPNESPEIAVERLYGENEEEKFVPDEELLDRITGCEYDGEDKTDCFCEPILQDPSDNTVTVQWFTEEEGSGSFVNLYENLPASCVRARGGKRLTPGMVRQETEAYLSETGTDKKAGDAEAYKNIAVPTRTVEAVTFKLSRIRGGKTDASKYDASVTCDIYKHVAVVDNIPVNDGSDECRITYSVQTDSEESFLYTLSSNPQPGTEMKILLTSDYQGKPMTAANAGKAYETNGSFDAIWMDGDITDVIDSAYNWFYADNAFWRVMTGTAESEINGGVYEGAPLVQEAPIYTAMGNHDVMGVYDDVTPLDAQFNNPKPDDFNYITYNEMFELPESEAGNEQYYAVSMGDVRLITLDVNRVWRLANVGLAGKYSEIPGMGEDTYGYGDFIFDPVDENSEQIGFLKGELASEQYKNAKYKAVMFHHEAHSLGNNATPPFTDPVAKKITLPSTGQEMVLYDYPIEKDYILNTIMPLLEANDTQLVLEAHSHIWCRFKTDTGVNVLETSNAGNSYGGYADGDGGDGRKSCIPSAFYPEDPYYGIRSEWDEDNYASEGDPGGLGPLYPNKADLPDKKPYLASNTITEFSILDTGRGCVESYYFDTEKPGSSVVLFDSFDL